MLIVDMIGKISYVKLQHVPNIVGFSAILAR